MSTLYHSIPNVPATITSSHILVRLVDSIGFRFRWATEGLTESNFNFKPCDTSMTIKELLLHIHRLSYMANKGFGNQFPIQKEFTNNASIITETLHQYNALSTHLKTMTVEDLNTATFLSPKSSPEPLPFWYMINGPLADALTHVGQISSWRRIAGNPQPKGVQLLLGKKL